MNHEKAGDFFLALGLGLGLPVFAADGAAWGPSVYFNLNEVAGDFGMSFGVQSPLLLGAIGARLEGVVQWCNLPGSAQLRYPYAVLRSSLTGYSRPLGDLRLYGYGGIEFAFPQLWMPELDTESWRFGGFGGFGFEFFATNRICYYIELGSTGSSAKSNVSQSDQRLYRNGFQTIVGLKLYL